MSDGLSNLKSGALALAGLVLIGGAIVADAVDERAVDVSDDAQPVGRKPLASPQSGPDDARTIPAPPAPMGGEEEGLVDDGSGYEPEGIDPSGYDPSPEDRSSSSSREPVGPEPIGLPPVPMDDGASEEG